MKTREQVMRENRKIKKTLRGVLEMLDEWDILNNGTSYSGFAGFAAIRKAERALGMPESTVQ